MRASELSTSEFNGSLTALHTPLLPMLTAAILSAALLFAVQPMFTKMVLPRLGGSPQVWSVAMAFFQAALLAGYAYAHLLMRFAPLRWSVLVHVAAMPAACLMLPLAIASGWGSDDWVLQEPDPSQRVWTDDYSNIVAALLRKLRN
jgi:hypothetical protein